MTDTETHRSATLPQILAERWSCRGFLSDQVDHETIVALLTLAQRAPSWCNTQPWRTYVTEGDATGRFRDALVSHVMSGAPDAPDLPMPREYTGVHLERRRESGWQLYEAVGVARGDREASAREAMRNFALFDAPHTMIITVDESQEAYGVLDAGVYVGTLLLAAQSLGLGAVPQAALAMHSGFIRDHFTIPANESVLLGVSFGYPDPDHPANAYRTHRADLDEVVRWVRL